jgi:hypothetical protein
MQATLAVLTAAAAAPLLVLISVLPGPQVLPTLCLLASQARASPPFSPGGEAPTTMRNG